MPLSRRMTRKMLGELLVQEGLVTEEQIQIAIDEQEKTNGLLGDILVDMGIVTERDITRAVVSQYSSPYLSVFDHYISKEMLDLFPAQYLTKHLFLPLDQFDNLLTVVTAIPPSDEVITEIEKRSGCKAVFFVSSTSELKAALERVFPQEAMRALDDVFPDTDPVEEDTTPETVERKLKIGEPDPV